MPAWPCPGQGTTSLVQCQFANLSNEQSQWVTRPSGSLSVFAFGHPYGPYVPLTLLFASIYWPNFTTQRLPLPFLARAFSPFAYFNSST